MRLGGAQVGGFHLLGEGRSPFESSSYQVSQIEAGLQQSNNKTSYLIEEVTKYTDLLPICCR